MPRLSLPVVLAFALLFATVGTASAAPGEPLNRAWLGPETFDESFSHPTIDPGRWSFNFWYGDQDSFSSRRYGDGGFMVFSSPLYNGVNPFEIYNSKLIIRAERTADINNPLNGHYPFTSGMITTFGSFSQQYGYFESKIRSDVAPGMWPAFWLLGSEIPRNKDMEIDIIEELGSTPGAAYQSTHYVVQGAKHDNRTYTTNGVDWSKDHVYGVLVTPQWLVFYIDDHETYRERNVGRFNMPMYMIVSLGVGPPFWNNNVPSPNFQGGKMVVSYIRAYALRR